MRQQQERIMGWTAYLPTFKTFKRSIFRRLLLVTYGHRRVRYSCGDAVLYLYRMHSLSPVIENITKSKHTLQY